MTLLNPYGIEERGTFLGNSILEWFLLMIGLITLLLGKWIGVLIIALWIENFGFYIIPIIFIKKVKQ